MSARRVLLAAAACLASVWAVSAADVVLRARSAYQEGVRYREWARSPARKAAVLDARLAEKEERLKARFAARALSAEELGRGLALARLERDRDLAESSWKLAYAWFKSSSELFTPPESRWSRQARRELPAAREEWEKELDSRKIPRPERSLDL